MGPGPGRPEMGRQQWALTRELLLLLVLLTVELEEGG